MILRKPRYYNRIKQDQTGSNRIKQDQTGSNRIKQDQTGSNRIKQDQTGSNRADMYYVEPKERQRIEFHEKCKTVLLVIIAASSVVSAAGIIYLLNWMK